MRLAAAALLLLCAGRGWAGDGLALVAIRDDPREIPDSAPARTVITLDVLAPGRLLASHEVTLTDPKLRRRLFADPFVVATGPGLAVLACPEGRGLRCQRFSWASGEALGASFHVEGAAAMSWTTRPRYVEPDRFAVLTGDALLTIDLKLARTHMTRAGLRPLELDPERNRLYLEGPAWQPLLPSEPPDAFAAAPKPLFALPDPVAPERAAFDAEGTRIAYASHAPSLRPDAARFVLSVADAAGSLLVRRSIAGRLRDLRWLDGARVLFTTTHGEVTSVHVLDVGKDRLATQELAARYLAPPEIVPADLVTLPGPG